MFCTKCGAKAQEDKNFCIKCGEPLKKVNYPPGNGQNVPVPPNNIYQNEPLNVYPEKPKNNVLAVAIICVVAVIIAAVAVVGISFVSINIKKSENIENRNKSGQGMVIEKKNEYETPLPTQTQAPTPTPTPDITYRDYYFSPGYNAVNDLAYSFECPYPDEFVLTKNAAGYMFSSDALGIWLNLEARPNPGMLTGTQLLNEYKNQVEGEITYSASGEKWFAASYIGYDGIICYRKCIVNDLNIAYFDVDCTDEMLELASEYITYMEKHFKFK